MIGQDSKEPDSKHVRLSSLHEFCGNYSALQCSSEAAIDNMSMSVCDLVPVKLGNMEI